MGWTPPENAQTFPVRPLRGVWRSMPSQQTPYGGFYRLENALVTEGGLLRRNALIRRGGGDPIVETPEEVISIWKTDGSRPQVMLSDKNLYNFPLSLTPTVSEWKYWEDIALSVDSAGVVTLSGAPTGFVLSDVLAGDTLTVTWTDSTLGEMTETWPISIVSSATSIVLDNFFYATALTTVANADWFVQKTMGPGIQPFLDWTIVGQGVGAAYSGIIIAGGKRPLVRWDQDTDTLSYWTTATAKMFNGEPLIADAVTYFMDRVWVGSVSNATDGYRRQRIIWSTLADSSDFSVTTNYIDLPYVASSLTRLVPMGNHLVAYFTDGIFIGTPTQFPTIPLRFDRIDTGGIGLVGPKAVTTWFGGHFFVGQDDIYWLPYGATAPEAIGTQIFRDAIRNCEDYTRIRAASDPTTSSILFGFPKSDKSIEEIWYFNTKLKEWSSAVVTVDSISTTLAVDVIAWDSLTMSWEDLPLKYPTWNDMKDSSQGNILMFGSGGRIWVGSSIDDSDYGTEPVEVIIETGDIDFDSPDTMKTVLRVNMKIDRLVDFEDAIEFETYVSTNKGRAWKRIGTLHIPTSEDEGKIDFRATGSIIRIKFVSTSMSTSYKITEYGLRVIGSGDELSLTGHSK